MVSWTYNNAKDVNTEIDNTLRVSLAFLVKLKNNTQRRKDAMAQRTKISECISLGFLIVPDESIYYGHQWIDEYHTAENKHLFRIIYIIWDDEARSK